MGWLINSKNLFLTILVAEKSKIKSLTDKESDESLLPGSLSAAFCCALTWHRFEGALWVLFYKSTEAIHDGTTLLTWAPHKDPISKYYHIG